jgi:hypothetical protein
MLKAALRIKNTEKIRNNAIQNGSHYTSKHISGQKLDTIEINGVIFENFLFADCGMKGTIFTNCTFKNTIFAGCYMPGVSFRNCTLIGCQFEVCVTSGIKLEATKIEYIDFFRCALPFEELKKNLGTKHGSNDRMMLNCAVESHRIGNWKDAAKFLSQHHKEKRAYWKDTVFSSEEHFKKIPIKIKARNLSRLIISKIFYFIFGDSTSISRMIIIGMLTFFIIFPLIIFWKDAGVKDEFGLPLIGSAVFLAKNYISYILEFFNIMLGTNLPIEYTPVIKNEKWLEITSRMFGVVYLSVFSNIATKSLGKGPTW